MHLLKIIYDLSHECNKMNAIKIYEKLVEIETFDWIEYTPAKIEDIDNVVNNNKFIVIWEKRIAVHQIKSYYPKKDDWLISFIYSLDEKIRWKVLAKQRELKENLNKEMTIEYAQNYVTNLYINK